jgi:hypothetical protein
VLSSSSTLEKILQLKPSSFDWKSNSTHDVGLIAQEVELIFPELVFTNPTDGYKGINYSRFITLLISGVQEVAAKVTSLFDGTGRANVKELCIEDVCITKDQLLEVLEKNNINTPQPTDSTNDVSEDDPDITPPAINGTSTEEVVEDPITEEDTTPITDPVIVEEPTLEPVVEEEPAPEPVAEENSTPDVGSGESNSEIE